MKLVKIELNRTLRKKPTAPETDVGLIKPLTTFHQDSETDINSRGDRLYQG